MNNAVFEQLRSARGGTPLLLIPGKITTLHLLAVLTKVKPAIKVYGRP
jgi:hypothetical protein